MKRFLLLFVGVAILPFWGCEGSKKSLPVTLFKAMETGDTVRVEPAGGPERYKQGDAVKTVVSVFSKHRAGWMKVDVDPSTPFTQITVLKNNNTLGRFRVNGSDLFYGGDSEIWKTGLAADEVSTLEKVLAP